MIGFRRNLKSWIFVLYCGLPSHLPLSHFRNSSRYFTNQWHMKDYLFWNFHQKACVNRHHVTMWPAKCRSEIIPKLNMEDVITYMPPGQSCLLVTGLVKWWNGKKENCRNVEKTYSSITPSTTKLTRIHPGLGEVFNERIFILSFCPPLKFA